MVAAVKGYKLVLVMPESMSIERRRLMLAYGATFDLTPREKGMKGAIERALELVEQTPNAWMPQQFENPANIDVHVRTTAQEILDDFADSPIDVLITGVGTGGHITGVAETLKKDWPNLKVYAVEPDASPVISGGQPGPHPIQGIGAGFIPANLHTQALDGVIEVDAAVAKDMARRAATRGRHAGRDQFGRDAGRDPAEAARPARRRRACSGSTTTPASAICRCRTSCPKAEFAPGTIATSGILASRALCAKGVRRIAAPSRNRL